VDRSKSANRVDAIVDIFNTKEQFVLALSPEGTRKKVDTWKTGFYYIAKGANVPIVMIGLDFEHKKVIFSEPYSVTEIKKKTLGFSMIFLEILKENTLKIF